MRRLRLDSDQHGLVTALRRLQGRAEFERMAWDDTIVVIRGRDECGRIPDASRHVVHRRVLVQIGKVLRVLRGTVFGRSHRASREPVKPQHVQHSDGREGDGEQVGALFHHRADEQPTV